MQLQLEDGVNLRVAEAEGAAGSGFDLRGALEAVLAAVRVGGGRPLPGGVVRPGLHPDGDGQGPVDRRHPGLGDDLRLAPDSPLANTGPDLTKIPQAPPDDDF